MSGQERVCYPNSDKTRLKRSTAIQQLCQRLQQLAGFAFHPGNGQPGYKEPRGTDPSAAVNIADCEGDSKREAFSIRTLHCWRDLGPCSATPRVRKLLEYVRRYFED
jgi:hypothetical protein